MSERRIFSSIRDCKICGKSCSNLNGLSVHLSQKHSFKIDEYIVRYELNNNRPKCKCGCNQEVKWNNGCKFQEYLSGHFTKTPGFPNPWRKKGRIPQNKIVWTDEQKREILELFNEKQQLDKIAVLFNVKGVSIKNLLISEMGHDNWKKVSHANDKWRRKHDPIINQKIREAASKGGESFSKFNASSIEQQMKYFLNELNMRDSFKFQFFLRDYQTQQTFCYDFGSQSSKILIECDGDYWHANPIIYQQLNEVQERNKSRDRTKEEVAIRNGFKLFRFWESDIKKQPEKIKEVLNGILS